MRIFSPIKLVRFSIQLLPSRDRRLLFVASIFQIALSFLDLLGVAIIGVLGSLSVNGVQSKKPGDRVSSALELLQISDKNFQYQAAVLGVLAAVLLIGRTLLSVFFSRRTMYFLSRRGANISSELIAKLLNQSYLAINARSTQETIFALTSGITVLTLTVLGGLISLIADLSLLIVLTTGLMIVDFKLAVLTLILFSLIASLLYLALHKRVQTLGNSQSGLGIKVNEEIAEVLHSFRESSVRGRKNHYVKEISSKHIKLASIQAELSFIPNISKYVIEASLVLGTLVICAIQFKLQDATHAVGTLAIFLASASRIAPATLRIQQSALAFRNAGGNAAPSIELIESLRSILPIQEKNISTSTDYEGFIPSIEILNLEILYPSSENPALLEINMQVSPGETVAIVGPSGAGKTTLVDAILGILDPACGQVLISGVRPSEAIFRWPGAIGYVPQDVTIANRSILQNITMGFNSDEIDYRAVAAALKMSQLKDWVDSLPSGLETLTGERGTKVSGGQRQRLGIARALYTKPKLLVLDEATSALDGQTEEDISTAIKALKGNTTVVLIAHRLSTVLHADRVLYLENGRIVASGTFQEVRNLVPNFDSQARLMGI